METSCATTNLLASPIDQSRISAFNRGRHRSAAERRGCAMTDVLGVTDVQRRLVYTGGKIGWWFLKLGVTALGAGAFLLWLQPSDFSAVEWMMVGFSLAVGAASAVYGFVRWRWPQPMLTLSSSGRLSANSQC